MLFSGVNGFKKRSISDQIGTFGYDLTVNVDNTAGSCQVGFSGDHSLAAFTFAGGKITDPAGNFVQSYNANTDVFINGVVRQDSYDYFINGEPVALGYPWTTGRYSWFFVNPNAVNADIDLDLSGIAPTYSASGSGFYTGSGAPVSAYIVNQTPEMRFRIFGAEVNEYGSPYRVQSFETGYITDSGHVTVSSLNATNSSVIIPITLYTNFGEVDFDFFVGGNNVVNTPNPQNIYLEIAPATQTITSSKGFQQFRVSYSNAPSGVELDVSLGYASGVTGIVYKKTLTRNLVDDETISGWVTGAQKLSRFISHEVTGYDSIGKFPISSPSGTGIITTDYLYATGPVFLPYNLQVTGLGQGTTYQSVLATGNATVEITGRANFLGTFVNVIAYDVAGIAHDPVLAGGIMPTASGQVLLLPTGNIPVTLDPSDYYVGYLTANVCFEGDLTMPYSVLGVGYATGRHIVDKVRSNFNSCFEPGLYHFDKYFSGQGVGQFASWTLFDPVKCNLEAMDVTGLITGDFSWEGMLSCVSLTGLPTIEASGVPIAIYNHDGLLVTGNKSVFLMEPASGYSPYESSYLAAASGIKTRTQISHSGGNDPHGTGFFDQVINTCGYAEGIWSETIPTYTHTFVCDAEPNGPSYFNGQFFLRSGSHEEDFYHGTIDSGVMRFSLTGNFASSDGTHLVGIRMLPVTGQPLISNPDFFVFRDGSLIDHWEGWTSSGTQIVMVSGVNHYYTFQNPDGVFQLPLTTGNYEIVMRFNDNPYSDLPRPICDYAYFPCLTNLYPEDSIAYVPIMRAGNDITRPLTVAVTVTPGTARAGVDYQYTGTTITWKAGDAFEKMVEVSLEPDARFDPYHTIEVSVPVPNCYLGEDLSIFSSEIIIQPDTCCCPKPDIVAIVPLPSENFFISGSEQWVSGGGSGVPVNSYVPIYSVASVDAPYKVTGMRYFIDCIELTGDYMITPFSGQWPARDANGNVLVGEHVLKAYALTDCVGVGDPCEPYVQTLGGTLTGCRTSGFEEVPFYVYEQPCANYYDTCDIGTRFTGGFKSSVNNAYGTYAMLPEQDFTVKWHTNAVRQNLRIWSYDSGCNETLLFDTKCSHIGELILSSANHTSNLDWPPFFAVNLSGELNARGPYMPRNLYYNGVGVASGVPVSSFANIPVKDAGVPFPGNGGWAAGFDPNAWEIYHSRFPVSGSTTGIIPTGFLAPATYDIIGECNVLSDFFPGDNVLFTRDFTVTSTTHNGFAGMNLVGNAFMNGGSLRLTNATTDQGGAGWLSIPASAVVSFSTTFSFQITNMNSGGGGDGLAFVLQTVNDSQGSHGGGLGYGGISPSIAVEFDTYYNAAVGDPDGNHVGINVNGNLTSVVTASQTTKFANGLVWNVKIDYDGVTLFVTWWQNGSTMPTTPQLSYVIDVSATIGNASRYAGFTAACGAAYENHDITSWTYQESRRLTPFTDPAAELTLNGNAYIYGSDSRIRLTESVNWQDGNAFIELPPSEIVSFTSNFTFQITNPTTAGDADGLGADGLTFILQTYSKSFGDAGGGIGYANIQPSVAVEFDTYYNSQCDPMTGGVGDGNHVGININGNLVSVASTHEPIRFNNGAQWLVEIDYDGTTLKVYWWQSTGSKPSTPQLSHDLDILSIIGSNSRYAGFTAACGAGNQTHDILSWNYQETRIESDPYITINSLNSNYFVEPLTLSAPPITYFLTTLPDTTYIRVEIGAKCSSTIGFPPPGPGGPGDPGGPGTGGPGGPGGGNGGGHDHSGDHGGHTSDPGGHDCNAGPGGCIPCTADPCIALCVCDGCCIETL